jgi:hypothetical protein
LSLFLVSILSASTKLRLLINNAKCTIFRDHGPRDGVLILFSVLISAWSGWICVDWVDLHGFCEFAWIWLDLKDLAGFAWILDGLD